MVKAVKKEHSTSIEIRHNQHGNFEHADTGLVISEVSKKVVGTQLANGDIAPLTDDDIDKCKQYKLEYQLPTNLDSMDLDRETVEDLDNEESDIEEVSLLEGDVDGDGDGDGDGDDPLDDEDVDPLDECGSFDDDDTDFEF